MHVYLCAIWLEAEHTLRVYCPFRNGRISPPLMQCRFEFQNHFRQSILESRLIIFLSKNIFQSFGRIQSQGAKPQHTLTVCSIAHTHTHTPHACSNEFYGWVIYAFKMWPHCPLNVHNEIKRKHISSLTDRDSEMQPHTESLEKGHPPHPLPDNCNYFAWRARRKHIFLCMW